MRFIYTILSYLALPFVFLRLLWRSRRLPAYRKRLLERLGYYPIWQKATGGPLIWVHAVSVGEVAAATPLIQALTAANPTMMILLTTMTPTGAAHAERLLTNPQINHAYLPYDVPLLMRRFLKHFNPMMGVIIETELWPTLLALWHASQRPLFLMNARLSAQSARGYQRLGRLTRTMLQTFTAIAAQSQADAKRFIALGADPTKVHVTGNIKFDIELPAALTQKAAALRDQLGVKRFIWIAGSTHEGEEEQILAAHHIIRARDPNALLILVPRHPDRFMKVAKISGTQFSIKKRSDNHAPLDDTIALYLGDTMGELLLLYAVSDVVFVGGSLITQGGHNLLEPAALTKPIITGPHIFNFAAVSTLLKTANALMAATDSHSLAEAVWSLHDNPALAKQMGERAQAVVAANQGALAKQLAMITHCILPPFNESPSEVKIPNKTTIKAMHDADKRKTHKAKSVDALFEDLE